MGVRVYLIFVPAEVRPRSKRAFDLIVVVASLPIALPAFALLSIAVFLDSPGPVLYRARRVGLEGREFEMLKFRTMRDGMAGHAVAGRSDPRITRTGHFLRVSRLDELPQLWNVLRGEMSVVGPRPELESFVALHADDYREILLVPPGLTGPTQLRFAGVEATVLALEADPEAFYRERLLPDKVALDLAYARSSSRRLDFLVLCQTIALPATLTLKRFRQQDRTRRAIVLSAVAVTLAALVVGVGLGSPR